MKQNRALVKRRLRGVLGADGAAAGGDRGAGAVLLVLGVADYGAPMGSCFSRGRRLSRNGSRQSHSSVTAATPTSLGLFLWGNARCDERLHLC
jgi:hypothetical protein